jgi:hypothetical protein
MIAEQEDLLLAQQQQAAQKPVEPGSANVMSAH